MSMLLLTNAFIINSTFYKSIRCGSYDSSCKSYWEPLTSKCFSFVRSYHNTGYIVGVCTLLLTLLFCVSLHYHFVKMYMPSYYFFVLITFWGHK